MHPQLVLAPRMALQPFHQLDTLVENRTVYHFSNCELNVFETRQPSENVKLHFEETVITTMIRGKKIMHLSGMPQFDYLPGESVIVPARQDMQIDFPAAAADAPTQCLALAIEDQLLQETLYLLNEQYPKAETGDRWKIHADCLHVQNSAEITRLLQQIILLAQENSEKRNQHCHTALKQLLICLMQAQARHLVLEHAAQQATHHRFAYLMQYIRENLTENINIDRLSRVACMSRPHFFRCFKKEFGISPAELVIRERLKLAMRLLAQPAVNISEACYRSGFNNLSLFFRLFKKHEGITPKAFKNTLSAGKEKREE